jgi:hypothetical protein
MVNLLLISLPFTAIAAWSGRLWTIALPVVFWLAVAWLETLGILPGTTSTGAALLAGVVGAVFSGLGIAAHPRVRPRSA